MNSNKNLLSLLASSSTNIELAFQLCIGLAGNYSQEVAKELRQHPVLCVKYQLEAGFVPYTIGLSILQDTLSFQFITSNDNLPLLPLGHYPDFEMNDLLEVIGEFNQLKELDLSVQYLQFFPKNICKLRQLEDLDLSENQLKNLPAEIGQLKNLKKLNTV